MRRIWPGILAVCLFAPLSAIADKPLLLVTDSPYEVWQGNRTKVQVVVYSTEFNPVAGAQVFAGKTLVGSTDADGTLIFSHKPRGHFMLRATAEIQGEAASGQVRMEAYRRTTSFETANLFVYTDRGVYRPGEEVLVRSLAWRLRGEFKPIHKAEIEVSLHAPDGRPVTGGSMGSDAYGVSSTRLRVPEDALEGNYQLHVRYKGTQETARLRVERFKTPAIHIHHNLPRFIAPTTADLQVEVKLSYFTGGTPAHGSLEALVNWSGKKLFAQKLTIEKGKTLHFRLPLDTIRKVVPDRARFRVTLKAKDDFGRVDEVKRDILYAKKPYLAVADLDKDVYAKGETVNISVRLVDPDGVPVRGKALSLTGDGDKIKLTATTDDGGVAAFAFPMPDHQIQISVHSADVPQALIQRSVPYIAQKPMQAQLPKPVVKERKRTPIQITFDEGFVPVERVVHGDVVDYSGTIMGAFKIPIRRSRGRYAARGHFRAPAWGSMLITLYVAGKRPADRKKGRRPATVGLLTEGLSLTAHPDKELKVRLDGVPDKAAPRSEVRAQFSIRTAQNKKADSILGVLLVDRAILSLMDPLEKTPMDRFYNPTLKVLSTTGSDILTWPVVTRNWGPNQYDIALPPFGFNEGSRLYRTRSRRAKGMMKPKKSAPGLLGSSMDDDFDGAPMAEMAKEAPSSKADGAKMVKITRKKISIRAGAHSAGQRPAPQAKIVIRTDLPATAVWEPRLKTKGGKASLTFRLPESLTEQELIAVASDKRGGLALLRKTIKVTQPLFVRSDLPRTLTLGDKIQAGVLVNNTTGKPLSARVSIQAPGLKISPLSRQVAIPASGSAVAQFSIEAKKPGPSPYTVEARAGELSDGEKRTLDVRPRGIGIAQESVASLQRRKPYKAIIAREENEYVEAHLEIAFPTVVPALQEIEDLLQGSLWWADSHLATPLSAAQLERYLARHKPRHPLRKQLHTYLEQVAAWLPGAMNADGGTHWWRTGPGSQILSTAWALKLMAALRDADIAIPDPAIHAAVAYLHKQQQKDGLWSTNATAFWEGSTEKVRLQLGAQIFRSLAEAARVQKLGKERAFIEELSGRFAKYLDDGPDDPLTAAEAAHGLLSLERSRSKKELRGAARKRLMRAARRLMEMRKTSHWEPSWFHAYGGTIEATVTGLELLARLDPRGFESEIRAGLMYLLSTRKEWGMWHCPFGTAEALRAFTFLPPPKKEVPSVVSVRLGTAQIARVKIDPKDPYLSALRLRHLAFGSLLKAGTNDLTVTYDGRLEAPVRLIVRRWRSDALADAIPANWKDGPQLSRSLTPAKSPIGQPVVLKLTVDAKQETTPVRLVCPLPANTRPVADSLAALKKSPGVMAVDHTASGLSILLAGKKTHALSLKLEGLRTGTVELAPTRLYSTSRSDRWVATGTARLEVMEAQ